MVGLLAASTPEGSSRLDLQCVLVAGTMLCSSAESRRCMVDIDSIGCVHDGDWVEMFSELVPNLRSWGASNRDEVNSIVDVK